MIGRRAPQQDWYSIDAIRHRRDFPQRGALVDGRMPRDDRADEAFITLRTSRNTGLHVGDTVSFRAYDGRRPNTCCRTRGPFRPASCST